MHSSIPHITAAQRPNPEVAPFSLHDLVLPAMGRAAGTRIPAVDLAVYHRSVIVPLLLGGLVIATAGTLLTAGWAARTRTADALRTE